MANGCRGLAAAAHRLTQIGSGPVAARRWRQERVLAASILLVSNLISGSPPLGASSPTLSPPVPVTDFEHTTEAGPTSLYAHEESLYFSGPDEAGLYSIWRFRFGSLSPVATLCGGGSASIGGYLALPGPRLIFVAGDCIFGYESLWRLETISDSVSQIDPPLAPSSFGPNWLTRVGPSAYFQAYPNVLWKTDGTDAGTLPVRQFQSLIDEMEAIGNRLVFTASGGDAYRPWVSDGSEAGTITLAEVYPQSASPSGETYYQLEDRLLFVGFTLGDGLELWSTNGRRSETRRVSDLRPGLENPQISRIVTCEGVAYFRSNGLDLVGQEIGYELWRSDGTRVGTRPVIDLTPGPASSTFEPLGCIGPRILFFASDVAGRNGLFISDGTEIGTSWIKELSGLTVGAATLDYAGYLVFPFRTNAEGVELWVTDGTAEGTFLSRDIAPGETSSNPAELVRIADAVFFTADDGVNGRQIWRLVLDPNFLFSDGFESGSTLAWGGL